VDGMERKGHVDAEMSGVRKSLNEHAAQSGVGASPGHNDATASGVERWICTKLQALWGRCGGWRVVMTVKCSPGEVGGRGERTGRVSRRSAGLCVCLARREPREKNRDVDGDGEED
jgi:hypothetical protein